MPNLAVASAIGLGLAWATATFVVFQGWTLSSSWGELAALSAASGALMASMLGVSWREKWSRVDLIGKIVLDLAAVVGMIPLTGKVHRRRLASAQSIWPGAGVALVLHGFPPV
jgi:hypothetical protein